MGLREEKRAALRQAITATAVRMFHTKGYDRTRIQEIARRVRISEATFFNHFPSKQALLDAFTVDLLEGYAALLREKLLEDGRPVADRIRETVTLVGQSFAADRDLMALVATRSNLFYATTEHARARHHAAYDLLAQLLKQGQRSGELRRDVDPVQLAEILTATYMLTIANWLLGWWREEHDLTPRLSRAVDVFLTGCRSAPGAAARSRTRRRKP